MKKLLLPLTLCFAAAFTNADPLANQEWVRRRFMPLPSCRTLAVGAEETSITVECHVVTSLLPSAWTNESPRKVELWCNDTNRNYTLHFDDTPEVRRSLPITIDLSGILERGVRIYGSDTNLEISTLPAMIRFEEMPPGTLFIRRLL